MAKIKLLQDLYRFPGFVPQAGVRGIFGEPLAVVITLKRRRKKRFAASAGWSITVTTTSGRAESVISPVATNTFTSLLLCAESLVPGVGA
jgi:hypothetical protein